MATSTPQEAEVSSMPATVLNLAVSTLNPQEGTTPVSSPSAHPTFAILGGGVALVSSGWQNAEQQPCGAECTGLRVGG